MKGFDTVDFKEQIPNELKKKIEMAFSLGMDGIITPQSAIKNLAEAQLKATSIELKDKISGLIKTIAETRRY